MACCAMSPRRRNTYGWILESRRLVARRRSAHARRDGAKWRGEEAGGTASSRLWLILTPARFGAFRKLWMGLWFPRIRSVLKINELGRSLQNVNSSCQKVKANRLTLDLNVPAISRKILILRLIRFWLQTGNLGLG